MTQLDGKSMNIVSENIEKLRELFPEVFSEAGKIDFKKLEEELGQFTDSDGERYNFTWAGKSEAKKIAQTPSTGTLRPCKEDSKNWDTTQNLYIEGDNLEVLKLLQKSYHKKVKMIYIDPPYNTGKDFVYPDNFHDNIRNYLEITGQVDSEGKKLSANAETNGRYHSDWLTMMYPRLKLARNLLKDDGVIFISIDDNEVANLRKVCDEIFGEDNFIGEIVWQHSIQGKGYSGKLSIHHNYILAYSKSLDFELGMFQRTDEDNLSYSNPDNDPRGLWRTGDVRNALDRPNLKYNITTPNGNIIPHPENGWRWSKETLEEKVKTGEIIFNKDETKIIRKIYLCNQEGRVPESIFEGKKFGTTRDGTEELKKLFDKAPFDTPKPSKLIIKLLALGLSSKKDIVLDFFSGSATTADAVMQLNREDEGERQFIMVQLPEPTEHKEYPTICEIGKERIRRAGEKIIAANPEKDLSGLDIGFKVLKLDSSNIKAWDSDFENLEANLLDAVHNIKEDRGSEDILYEVLLKYGLNLTLPIEEKSINGSKIFVIGFGALIVCLDDHVTHDTVKHIAKLKEEYESEITRVVFKDSSFADAVVKTNALQTLKQFGIDEVVSI